MKNYTINTFGWLGMIIILLYCLTSCKKDNTITPSTTNITNINNSPLIGKWGMRIDGNHRTNDTIEIWTNNGKYYTIDPDNIGQAGNDTLEIILNHDNINSFIIPRQITYSSYWVQGAGYISNDNLYINCTTALYQYDNMRYFKY